MRWGDACARGGVALKMDPATGEGIGRTLPFTEYYLVPYAGSVAGDAAARVFFDSHYARPPSRFRAVYAGQECLTDREAHFLPCFCVQFCYYLCADFARSREYGVFARAAAAADRAWFVFREIKVTHR